MPEPKLVERLRLTVLLTVTWLPFLIVGAIWWVQDNYTPERAAIWFSGWNGK